MKRSVVRLEVGSKTKLHKTGLTRKNLRILLDTVDRKENMRASFDQKKVKEVPLCTRDFHLSYAELGVLINVT